MNHIQELQQKNRRNHRVILLMLAAVVVVSVASLFVGSSSLSFSDALEALLGGGNDAQSRIIWRIRMPRVLAAIVAGAGLSVAGLVMQTTLNNTMASPSTLGVSNAAVLALGRCCTIDVGTAEEVAVVGIVRTLDCPQLL